MYRELRDRTYKSGTLLCLVVKGTVRREVFDSAFRGRMVHHLYYNYVSPMFWRLSGG
ncbi:MAG: hypothetical protein IJU81_00170 [Bacteroidales bacterium]|nr:hypothetical protein [Bacteroidales bacterium]